MEPWSGCCSLVEVSSAVFAVSSVLAASAPEAPLMAGPVGVPMTPRAWHSPLVLAGPQVPEA